MDYASWTAEVQRDGGTATVLPSNVPGALQTYAGLPAARYSNALYTSLFNAGQIDPGAPQVASNSGQYVYVVAPSDVIATAPQTMTAVQRAENAIFTGGDIAAGAVGLPSLTGIESFLKDTGKQILIGVGVTLAAAYLLRRRR
jgi:hypothetical protein